MSQSESYALYDDLEDIAQAVDAEKLQKKCNELEKKNKILNEESIEMRQQIQLLNKEKETLENNIVAVYNTALKELARKDREIADLKSNKR